MSFQDAFKRVTRNNVACTVPLHLSALIVVTALLFMPQLVSDALAQTPDAQHKSWQEALIQQKATAPRCAQATYPEAKWHEVPCGTVPDNAQAKPKLRSSRILRPLDEASSGNQTALSSGSIKSATGMFAEIDNFTSVTGDFGGGPVANEFSIQMNTNGFSSPACASSTSGSCVASEQFVIDSGGGINIQTWLVNYLGGATTTCPAGYSPYASTSCSMEQAHNNLPARSFSSFAGATLTGEADPNGLDTLTMVVGGGATTVSISDGALSLAGHWNDVDFNVFGESNGVQAVFNPGTLLSVMVTLNDGTGLPPTCTGQGATRTLETSNLTLGPCTSFSQGASNPGIKFVESVPPILKTVSPPSGPFVGSGVTLSGTGFSKYMEASFGSYYAGAAGADCNGSTECNFESGRGTGTVPLAVANLTSAGEPGAFSIPLSYTFVSVPDGFMSPSSGSTAGGTIVTLTGSNFATSGTSVLFNINGTPRPVLNLSCASTTSCTFTTPPLPAGTQTPITVAATAAANGSSGTVGGFTYGTRPPPPPPPPHHRHRLPARIAQSSACPVTLSTGKYFAYTNRPSETVATTHFCSSCNPTSPVSGDVGHPRPFRGDVATRAGRRFRLRRAEIGVTIREIGLQTGLVMGADVRRRLRWFLLCMAVASMAAAEKIAVAQNAPLLQPMQVQPMAQGAKPPAVVVNKGYPAPDFRGMTLAEANAANQIVGKDGKQKIFLAIRALGPQDGVVASQAPAAGLPVLFMGRGIANVVMKVPQETVPSLTGKTIAEATVTLSDASLVLGKIAGATKGDARQIIFTQMPLAGTIVRPDSAVDVSVVLDGQQIAPPTQQPPQDVGQELKPAEVRVPAVLQLSASAAAAKLTAAGLGAPRVFGPAGGIVVLQTPGAGAMVAVKTRVRLTLAAQGHEVIIVPQSQSTPWGLYGGGAGLLVVAVGTIVWLRPKSLPHPAGTTTVRPVQPAVAAVTTMVVRSNATSAKVEVKSEPQMRWSVQLRDNVAEGTVAVNGEIAGERRGEI